MRSKRAPQSLSYPVRLPDAVQAAALRLLDASCGYQCHGGGPVGAPRRLWRAGDQVCLQTGHRADRLACSAWRPAMAL